MQKLSQTVENKAKTKNNKTFRPISALADMGLKVVVVFDVLNGFNNLCIDLFGCFGFFCFPIGFVYFKCALDSSKRLGRGCAPSMNKAFTLHGFPYTRGFPVYLIPLCKWFPLGFTRGSPCINHSPVSGISLYRGFPLTKDFFGLSFLRHFTLQEFPHVRGFLV